jgi:hypothetical protein
VCHSLRIGRRDPVKPFRSLPAAGRLLTLSLAALLPGMAGADPGASFGLDLGTLGFGGQFAVPLSATISARAGLDIMNPGFESEMDGVSYDLDTALRWMPLILDYAPGGGGFRLSAGLVLSMNDVTMRSISTQSVEIGGHTYSPEQFGTLLTSVDCRAAAPYLGMGFSRHLQEKGGIGVTLDLGAMFQGYSISLSHDGGSIPPELEAQLLEDLAAESQVVQDDLNGKFGVFPVLTVGLSLGI